MLRSLCAILFFAWSSSAIANTYGSVEPIPSRAVLDPAVLRGQSLAVREQFAQVLAGCGVIQEVVHTLSSTGGVATVDDLNTSFAIGAGGFAGETNPSYVFTFIDNGPNAASHDDVATLTNALAYVLSQDSAFLLDPDDPGALDFPANYLVVNFATPPSIEESAALFETVGDIDPDLFLTDTSGYTQYGRAYLSLQSAVDDAQFIAGYREAAEHLGLEVSLLSRGGAAFPGNDWRENEEGEGYLSRIPVASHASLISIRERYLRLTDRLLAVIDSHAGPERLLMWRLSRVRCQ